MKKILIAALMLFTVSITAMADDVGGADANVQFCNGHAC